MKVINKNKYTKKDFKEYIKSFIIYINCLISNITIYLARRAKTALLFFKNILS